MAHLQDYSHLYSVFGERDIPDREWRALSGLSLSQTEVVIDRYWAPREHELLLPARKEKHLIWCLNFLKVYAAEDAMFGRFTKSKETYRKHVFNSIDFLAENLDEVCLYSKNNFLLRFLSSKATIPS